MDAKEALAQGDEASDVQNRVGRELVKLHAIDKEQPTKEFVGGKREAMEKEINKHYPPSFIGVRHGLVAGGLDLRLR